MSLFVRIDDRLIHGQVIVGWLRSLGANQIIVADDEVSTSAFKQNLLKMPVPSSVNVSFLSLQQAAETAAAYLEDGKAMLLAKGPREMLQMVEHGLALDAINIGNMHYEPGKEKLTKQVSVNAEERQAFEKLLDHGITLQVQWLPAERKVDLAKVLDKG